MKQPTLAILDRNANTAAIITDTSVGVVLDASNTTHVVVVSPATNTVISPGPTQALITWID